MRAVVVTEHGAPDVLGVTEVPRPEPGPDEVLVEVSHAGVGLVDVLFRDGTFDFLEPPFPPGIEVSGVVAEVGSQVADLRPGQRVAALLNDFFRGSRGGGYAELVNARADLVVPLPDGLDPAVAAGLVANGATAWMSLHDIGRLEPTDTLVVLGASGGVGGMAARLARALGVERVVGVAGSPARVDAALANGCHEVVLAGDSEALDAVEADLVLDPVGGDLRRRLLGRLRPFARYVVIGDASGEDTAVQPDTLWHSTAVVGGFNLGGVAHLHADRVREAIASVLALAADARLEGPAPEVVPLEQAADAHRRLEERAAPSKIVLAVGQPS